MRRSSSYLGFAFLLAALLCYLPLSADRIEEQLQLVLPGTDSSSQQDRHFIDAQLRQLIAELESDRIVGKSYRKQLDWIQQRLDGGFFRTYNLDADLADLFRSKQYNDVSVSIAYALLLEHFEIPYVAVINHWEAQLLADPIGRARWLTAPGLTTLHASRELAFRQDYVNLLNLTVLPGQRPVGQESADSLFSHYYYSAAQPLSFNELAAYYHYQTALQAYGSGDYLKVIQVLNVARKLDPRPIHNVLEQAAYLQLARQSEEEEGSSLYYLFELWNKDPYNSYIPQALLSHFAEKSEELITIGHGFDSAEQLYLYLRSRGVNFPAWQRQLKELYFFQRGRYADKVQRDDLVLNYMDSLFSMRPDETFYQEAIASLCLRAIRAENLAGTALSQRINNTVNRYPFLANHKVLADLTLGDLAKTVRARFVAEEPFAGEQSLVELRRSLNRLQPSPQREIWVLEAYLAASYYYFLQANYERARQLVDEALGYAPANEYLLHQQELLKNY